MVDNHGKDKKVFMGRVKSRIFALLMEEIYFSIENIKVVGWVCVAVAVVCAVWLLTGYRRRVLQPARLSSAQAGDEQAEVVESPMPPVSIVIYSCGNVDGLAALLQHVALQRYDGKVEAVVVNDGTSGEMSDVVTRFGIEHPEVDVYYTHVPDGARNLSRRKLCLSLGIKAARHDYVVFTTADCSPASDRWLHRMMLPLTQGKDVVLGYGAIDGLRGGMNRFDEVATAVTWLTSAICGRPYRGCAFNLAYRKALFFEAKGFARTLTLHYGDDDLFINQITTRGNTAVVLAPEALVTARFTRPAAIFRELRLRHCFTGRMLKGVIGARLFFRLSNITMWLWLVATVVGLVFTLPNALPGCLLVALIPGIWIPLVMAWKRTGRALGVRLGATLLPCHLLFRWVRTAVWGILSGMPSRKNHTWRN